MNGEKFAWYHLQYGCILKLCWQAHISLRSKFVNEGGRVIKILKILSTYLVYEWPLVWNLLSNLFKIHLRLTCNFFHNLKIYRHGQHNPDSHSTMRLRIRLPMSVQSCLWRCGYVTPKSNIRSRTATWKCLLENRSRRNAEKFAPG